MLQIIKHWKIRSIAILLSILQKVLGHFGGIYYNHMLPENVEVD